MNKIRFAIIGCGQIAQRHAKHIHAFGKLVAVCDIVKIQAVSIRSCTMLQFFFK
jgi:UDP-N-acetyl-2-amino-2-deoxyglucuronate dehydrogenase